MPVHLIEESFHSYTLHTRGFSPDTVRRNRNALRLFFNTCDIAEIEQATADVVRRSNGDAMHVRIQGMDTYKDEKLQTSDGTWSFVGGTGKLKGIKGKGTYKGKPDAAGNVVYDIAGEYEIPK